VRLLVSVRGAAEAAAAVAGGADVVDVKNPAEGALGAPTPGVVAAVRAAVPAAIPVSVALGDLPALPGTAALAAAGAAAAGAGYVKVGLWGPSTPAEAVAVLRAARDALDVAAPRTALVGCAYADAERLPARPLDPRALPAAAREAGADGVLIDTAVKDGRGLLAWLAPEELSAWVAEAHAHGLEAALAGALRAEDLPAVLAAGADVAGVRSAACAGGRRDGPLEAGRVRALRALCHPAAA
jgi:uncharacterized protein (UPF0264 family)